MSVKCGYCGREAQLIDSTKIYGKDHGMVWHCKHCNALVHTKKDNKTPLGTLANRELRYWRRKAHKLFDRLWNSKGKMTREGAYRLLQQWMGCPVEEVVEAVEAGHNRQPVSLDQTPGTSEGDQSSPAEWLGFEDSDFETAENRIMLRAAMDELSGEEQMVVQLRFREELTQSEIAERIGHSQMHVSRMLRRILDRMGDRLPAAA